MVERIYLEAENPLNVEIILQPKWMNYTHKRLFLNSNLYRMMVAYIFKDVQNSPRPKLNISIQNIPKIMNRNSYRNVEISSANVELADDDLPRWDDEDFSEYIKKFLDVLERQNINTLSKHLTTDDYLKESFFDNSTIKRMNKDGFSVQDLMNRNKFNRIINYIQDIKTKPDYVGQEDYKIKDRHLMSKIEDGIPLIEPYLEEFVKHEKGVFTVNTTNYVNKLTIGSGLGSIKGKGRFQYRSVKESGIINVKLGSKIKNKLVYLRINEDNIEINGILGEKTFTGENQIVDAYNYFMSLNLSSVSLDLLDNNKGNRIKDLIISALTVGADLAIANRKLGMHETGQGLRSGSLLVGKFKIEYEKQPNYVKEKAFIKKVNNVRNPDLPTDKQEAKEGKKMGNEINDYFALQSALEILEKKPNNTEARVLISRLEDEYDKDWVSFASSASVEEFTTWQTDTEPIDEGKDKITEGFTHSRKKLINLIASTEKKIKTEENEDSPDKKVLESLDKKIRYYKQKIDDIDSTEVSTDIPLIYLTKVYLEKEYEIDFKVSRLNLGRKSKGAISMETIKDPKTKRGGGEELALRETRVNDVKDLNRLKAAYMGLSRMVENYG